MEQRSVQMRLGVLDNFACPLGADDRGAQMQSVRGSRSPTHVPQFVLGTTLHVLSLSRCSFACKAFSSMVLWLLVVFGELAVLL